MWSQKPTVQLLSQAVSALSDALFAWMVVMPEVRRQLIANDIVAGHGCLKQALLYTPRQVGPQRKRGSTQQTLELES